MYFFIQNLIALSNIMALLTVGCQTKQTIYQEEKVACSKLSWKKINRSSSKLDSRTEFEFVWYLLAEFRQWYNEAPNYRLAPVKSETIQIKVSQVAQLQYTLLTNSMLAPYNLTIEDLNHKRIIISADFLNPNASSKENGISFKKKAQKARTEFQSAMLEIDCETDFYYVPFLTKYDLELLSSFVPEIASEIASEIAKDTSDRYLVKFQVNAQ